MNWAISNPEYADYILASVVKRVDVFSYTAIEELINGTFEGGIDMVGTLENKGTALAYGGRCAEGISDELKAEIEVLTQKIISGEIATVPPQ